MKIKYAGIDLGRLVVHFYDYQNKIKRIDIQEYKKCELISLDHINKNKLKKMDKKSC